ncbi:MAG: Gfo/Idh/MocA family protein, partial [Acidobacteriota bacterium]
IRKEIKASGPDKQPQLFLVDDRWRDVSKLPESVADELAACIKRLEVKSAIIATEPKAHKAYIKYFLQHKVDVLVDKPLTAPANASLSLARARQLYADYLELLQLSQQHPDIRLAINCKRRYSPVFNYVKKLLDQAVLELQIPVTHISVYGGNGHWNMPPEFASREDHPHKYGYGKLLHSGYHYIDLFTWFAGSNDLLPEDRRPNRIRLVQQTQKPEDFLFQVPQTTYQKFFGKGIFDDFFQSHSPEDFAGFGETESCSVVHLLRDNRVVTSGIISLVDTTASRRTSPYLPGPESDLSLNSGLGRIRHSQVNISVGPLLTIQVHSYKSYDERLSPNHAGDATKPGQLNHEDVYIFRNEGIIGK